MRKLAVAGCLILVLALAGYLLWNLLGLAAPRLLLRYGLMPSRGPTGRTQEIEGVTFVEIGAGYFVMGSHYGCETGDVLGRICAGFGLPWGKQPLHDGDECPPDWVEVGETFWIARTEVTNQQYELFDRMHTRAFDSTGDSCPVADVTWDDAQAYCAWLSRRGGLRVRLPSESEWEYACRAGSSSDYSFGANKEDLGEYAWFSRNSQGRAHDVALLRPNRWGLFDMHGNVWEWCQDAFETHAQRSVAGRAADGVDEAYFRVKRGGSYLEFALGCRSAERGMGVADSFDALVGFRPAADGR